MSQIENGLSPVDKRSTLEAFATALRVAPSELTGGNTVVGPRTDPEVASAVAAMSEVEAAMTDVAFGEATVPTRPWAAVACDVEHLNTRLRPAADYGAQMTASHDRDFGQVPGSLLEGQLYRRSNFGCRAMRPAADGNLGRKRSDVRLAPVKPGLTFHGLRHSHKTWFQVRGVAADATFGKISERLLPATSLFGAGHDLG